MPLNTVMPIDFLRAGAGAAGNHQRRDAEDERKRRHDDRPEPFPRRLDRRFKYGLALAQRAVARHVHDQNGVLGRERHQQDDADLGIQIVVDAQPDDSTRTGPTSASGTDKITDSGVYQLSY